MKAKHDTKPRRPQSESAQRLRHTAVRLITTELAESVAEAGPRILCPDAAASYLCDRIGSNDREHFVVLHLDNKLQVTGFETVSIGIINQAHAHPREVFKAAILANSYGIICGHNHPSGDLEPSAEDRAICARLQEAGKLLGIELFDFVVVSRSRHISLCVSPLSRPGSPVHPLD